MDDMQVDMNEMNKENVELNNHIYSIDVYMREKETQCEHLQKEKEDLLVKLSNSANQQQQQQQQEKNNDESNKSEYQVFIEHFKETLLLNTKTPREFVNYLLTICNSLLIMNEKRESEQTQGENDDDNESCLLASLDLQKLIDLSSKQLDKKTMIDLKCFRRVLHGRAVDSQSSSEWTLEVCL
jgi:hypothetical protein